MNKDVMSKVKAFLDDLIKKAGYSNKNEFEKKGARAILAKIAKAAMSPEDPSYVGAIAGYSLKYVYQGMDVLDSNTYQYVCELVDGDVPTGVLLMWTAPYTSYDNGGPDGDLDGWWCGMSYQFVQKTPITVEVWQSVNLS